MTFFFFNLSFFISIIHDTQQSMVTTNAGHFARHITLAPHTT
jgi:hypothetical protein